MKKSPKRKSKTLEKKVVTKKIVDVPVSVQPHYELILTIADKIYSSSGDSMAEALFSLPKPEKIFIKGTLSIRKGDRTRERALVANQIKKLFYPLSQKILAKQLEVGL